MNKKTVIIIFIGMIIGEVFSQMQPDLMSPKIFVGYMEEKPVFDSFKEKRLYILNDNELVKLIDYPSTYSVITVKDSYIHYQKKMNDGSTKLIISENGHEEQFTSVKSFALSAFDNNGTLYYTDIETKGIHYISGGQVNDFGIKGHVISIIDDFLYFSQELDSTIIYPNVNIFEINLRTLTSPQRIVSNVCGENTVIFPSRKYIFDQILKEGRWVSVIYDVINDVYIDVVQNPERNHPVFYSYQEHALVSFDILTLKMTSLFY